MRPESPKESDPEEDIRLELLIPQDIEDQLVSTRRIQLIGEINEGAAVYVNTYLRFFTISDQSRPVFLYISSPGGDLSSGYSIIDQMEMCPFDVYTIVQGQAHSMAAIVAAYGARGCRFITKNSSMMIHNPIVSGGSEPFNSHKKSVDFLEQSFVSKIEDLAKKTNLSSNRLRKLMADTLWINATEAIKIGIVDGVWDFAKEQMVNENVRGQQ